MSRRQSIYQEALSLLHPVDFESFLRARRWHQDVSEPEFSIWSAPGGVKSRIFIPRTSSPGAAARIVDALDTLSTLYELELDKLTEHLASSNRDTIQMRVSGEDTTKGMLRLSAGARFVDAAYGMFKAAAYAASSVKYVVPSGTPPEIVSRFLDNLLLGQTERGSFVVNVHSRVDIDYYQQQFVPEEPFGRKVSRGLFRALETVESEQADIDEMVAKGVTANLCESVAKVVKLAGIEYLQIKSSWTNPEMLMTPPEYIVNFSSHDYDRLKERARDLRKRADLSGVRLTGKVVGLDRAESDESGQVRIRCKIPRYGERTVRVTLGAGDYLKAVEAHHNRSSVSVTGNAQIGSNTAYLKEPRDLSIAPPTVERQFDLSDDT